MAKENIVDMSELSVADDEAKASADLYTLDLAKPFEYEGKTFTQLNFDFGKLTGEDSLAIEGEMMALSKPLITPEFSGEFLIRMASRACVERCGSDVLRALPLKEYGKIRSHARSFLLRSES